MSLNTVNQLRMCNRKISDFMNCFAKHFMCVKPIEKVNLYYYRNRPPEVEWTETSSEGFTIHTVPMVEAARCLHKRTIRHLKVWGPDGLVEFCRDSEVSVRFLDTANIDGDDLTILPEVLRLLQPSRLSLTITGDPSVEQWNRLVLPTGITDLIILSLASSKATIRALVPLGIENVSFKNLSACERSVNRALKNWIVGGQNIVEFDMYGCDDSFVDRDTLFEGIDITVGPREEIIKRNDGQFLKADVMRMLWIRLPSVS